MPHNIVVKQVHIDGLVQERRNSSALAQELSLSCINPSILLEAMLTYYQSEPQEPTSCEIWIKIQTYSLKEIHLKISSAKWQQFCLSLKSRG